MRKIIMLFLLLFSLVTKAQDCEIIISGDVPSCPGSSIMLSVSAADSLRYEWSPGGDTTSFTFVSPKTTTTYSVRLYNANYECTADTTIEVYPQINVDFEQLNLTCYGRGQGKCQAKVRAIASGAFESDEYRYLWEVPFVDFNDSALALGLCGDATEGIQIIDPYGCALDTSYRVKFYLSPKVDISFDPDTTTYAYLQNPRVQFFYNNLSADTLAIPEQIWAFGDGETSDLESPEHIYDSSLVYPVELTVIDEHGCDTTYVKNYEIKPVDLFIPNIFTPNGDGENDVFAFYTEGDLENQGEEYLEMVDLSLYYIRSELVVFNRYGRKVFESKDYDNDWDGNDLPEGVYYFVLNCEGLYRYDVFKGSVTLLR